MLNRMKAWILFTILLVGHAAQSSVWTSKRMKMDEKLTQEIETVLSLTADFHKERVEKEEDTAQKIATDLAVKLVEVKALSERLNDVQNVHITKILDSAYTSLKNYNDNPKSTDAVGGLKDFFKEIVQITQVFDVKKYKIFFCPLDRSLWLQKDSKARNPVNLKFLNCGKPV